MKIIAESLYKRFNLREWIFKDLNFELNIGNRYGIAGANGAGKSTLLSILAGISLPSKGKVIYLSNDKKELDSLQWYKYLSIATPYSDLIDYLTPNELLDFYCKFKNFQIGITKKKFLEIAYLTDHQDKYIKHFSSGMKQRLKLALAIISDSEILFLDEPGSNLDAKASEWYYNLLDEYTKNKLVVIASNEEKDFLSCEKIISLGGN